MSSIILASSLLAGVAVFSTSAVANAASPAWQGRLRVYNNNSNFCLTANGVTTKSPIELDVCTGANVRNQTWSRYDLKTISLYGQTDVQVFDLQLTGTNECVDDWGQSKNPIQQKLYPCTNAKSDPAEQWVWGVKFTSLGDSPHQLANLASGNSTHHDLCLDDWRGSDAEHTPVDIYTCKTTSQSNQEWFEN